MQPGNRIAHFEIMGLVGAGGMGEVYRARDTRLGRDVAIKVLPADLARDPVRLRRFEQEARAVAALNHPHILAIHDIGTHEGTPYIVTELLVGESLADRLRDGAMPVRNAIEIAVQIARGLAAAHDKGIVHRDLKPGNVFVTEEGHVKILDFGLAKLAGARMATAPARATTAVGATEIGTTVGTVGYMSPEQVRGGTVDHRSDIFSFGCVLYEMLFGRRAFEGATRADTLSAILHEAPPGLEGPAAPFPGPLREVMRRCLEKRAADRFSSARDIALALLATASSDLDATAAIPVRRERHLWSLALAAGGIIALAALAVLRWGRVARSDALPPYHTRQVTGYLQIVGRAAISPGGTEIAYATMENGKSGVWITDIRGGNPLRLTAAGSQSRDPAWFPDGSTVVFTVEEGPSTSIWKVPRLGGAPILLLPNAEQAAVSPDGTEIAFSRRADGGFLRIWIAKVAAPEGARKITAADGGLFDQEMPAWSPDGKTVSYFDARDIWVVPAAGGTPRRLMQDDPADTRPAWSADGRSIYFTSSREGTLAIWRAGVGGGVPIRVTDGTGSEACPTLSRDGGRFAFVSRYLSGDIVLVDLRTGSIARVQEGNYSWLPAIAPDRGALVFVAELADSKTLEQVPLRDGAPSGPPSPLTDQEGDIASPSYSPDGRWVAYYRAVGGQRDVWVVPAHGGSPVNFSNQEGQNVQPVWSPDATKIAFVSNRGGAYQIWVAPFADGRRSGEPRRITTNEGTAAYPSWSPDGRTIAYVSLTEAGKEVWAAPAEGGGEAQRLTSGAAAFSVRWFNKSNELLVSGYWGAQRPAFRLLNPKTGALRPFALPGTAALDPDNPDFDVSPDGSLLALFESKAESVIWLREAEKGSF